MKGSIYLGGAIAYLAWRRNLSRHALAEKLGASRAYLIRVENGAVNMGPAVIERIAAALEVSARDLLLLAETEIAQIFSEPLAREVAKHLPMRRDQRNEIVRFINANGRRAA